MSRQKDSYLNKQFQAVLTAATLEIRSAKGRFKYDSSLAEIQLVAHYVRDSDGFTYLFAAVQAKDKKTVEGTLLLGDGKHVDTYHEYQAGAPRQSPLTYAAIHADDADMLEILELLAKKSEHPADALRAVIALPDAAKRIKTLAAIPEIARDLNTQSPGRPAPLSLAAFHSNEKAFEALLEARNQDQPPKQPTRQKVPENIVTAEGATLLHQAVLGADDEDNKAQLFISRLLDKDMKGLTINPWPSVPIDAPSGKDGPTALSLACAQEKPNIIHLLISANADITQALQLSSRLGNIDALNLLLKFAPERATIMTEKSENHPLFLALKAGRQHLLNTTNNTGAQSAEPKYERLAKQHWVQVQEKILSFLHRNDQPDSPNSFVDDEINRIENRIRSITDPELQFAMENMYTELKTDYATNAKKIANCVVNVRRLTDAMTKVLETRDHLDNSSITGAIPSSSFNAERRRLTNNFMSYRAERKQYKSEKTKLIAENVKILGQLFALNDLVSAFRPQHYSLMLNMENLEKAQYDFLAFCEHKTYSETNRTHIAIVVGAVTGSILGIFLGVIFAILATSGTASLFVVPTTANLGAKIGAAIATAAVLGVIGGSIGESTENTQVKNWRDHFFAVSNQVTETLDIDPLHVDRVLFKGGYER